MNWLLRVKGKRYKICAIFVMIIALVLLQNVLERRHISNLDHSVAAIYKDRLLPATYLYGISNHLHQQRLLAADATYSRAAHDVAITNLIKEYELTHLTPEEKSNGPLLNNSGRHIAWPTPTPRSSPHCKRLTV
ncbi:MCP four helix bundle domain-containing protein [Chitinophaga sedimenti]|uniref:MCP four helix bundle domain-containing protein n=1 Tax=Chitinophaga sedimenti TaxID=2033606 RepID=UPI0020068A25|nr:MCP four helix bundle domain-containing protein [Chitinophaga sedimenti]MCK7555393.1 MCP four helix bundle domain-containing protein [Chitinophaga sedimenti]